MKDVLVESPGTAPGSDPLITSAFMFIVPRDKSNIAGVAAGCKCWMPPVGIFFNKRSRAGLRNATVH
jgi:hypothetical protein